MTDQEGKRPILTVDVVIVTVRGGALQVLLQRRPAAPFAGAWALPGGWVHIDEDASAEAAAHRVLQDKIAMTAPYIEQLGAWSGQARDPRGWSATIVFLALLPAQYVEALTDDGLRFFPMTRAQGLDAGAIAFDHVTIIEAAFARIRAKASYSTIPAAFLGESFSLPELKTTYELVLGHELNDSSFRRRFKNMELLEEVGLRPREQGDTSRQPTLYRLRGGFETFEMSVLQSW